METFFKLRERGSSVRTEVIGGVTTFITMAYIMVVNPAILSFAGIPAGPGTVATILTAVVGCLLMGLMANRPIAVAPYMGENAFIAFGLAALGIGWEQRLGAVFVSGVLFVIITLLGVRGWLANAVPPDLKHSFAVGIGLFLAIAAALGCLGARWPQLTAPVLAWSAVYVLLLAVQTGSQVQIWSSAPLLRLNYVNQHPLSFRANEEMAIHLAGVGALEQALAYSQRAGKLSNTERTGDRQIRDLALYCLANRPVPDALLQQLGTVEPRRPFAVVSTFQGFAKILQRGACPAFDRIAFAERMAQLFLAEGTRTTASPNFYAVLAGIENDLQRYDRAFAYTEKFLELAPHNVQGLLMQLHFATALGRQVQAQSAIRQLRLLQDAGRMNRGEIQTLELYR